MAIEEAEQGDTSTVSTAVVEGLVEGLEARAGVVARQLWSKGGVLDVV